MKPPFKTLCLSFFILALIAVNYLACNKDNNTTAKTTIKCVSCANGGSCINDTCRCPAGFEGVTCETESILKFTQPFEWIVSERGSATGQVNSYNIELEEQNNSFTTLLIYNLYSPYYFFSSSVGPLTANIDGDSIFIPSQAIDSGYIVGKGYYTTASGVPTVRLRYQVTNTVTGITNDFGYSNAADSPSVWRQE